MLPILCDTRWVSHKNGCLLQAKKVAILSVELHDLSENHHILKAPYITHSQNFWSGSNKMDPIFHKLGIK